MGIRLEYICALTNLYGHATPELICEIYNQQNHDACAIAEFDVFLMNPKESIENRYVYIKNGTFIEETLYLFKEKYEQLCAEQAGKPYYIPEKYQLLRFADLNYWEKPLEYEELEAYILREFFPNQKVTGLNLADELFYHMADNNFEASLQTLIHYEVLLDEDKASDPFLNIMQRLHNNTRMRAHKAHTPIEISKLTGESVYILPDKRLEDDNDCHCGSKKKYKECHLTDDDKIRRLSEYRNGLKKL